MAGEERFVVGEDDDARRLDQLLASRASVGSRGKARRALQSGKVFVDGQCVGPEDGGRSLSAGAVVELRWNRPGTAHARNASRQRLRDAGVTVLVEDDAVLALDKPPGLLTDAATRAQRREEDTLTLRARGWCGRRDVWPVHRIDRDTSGLVLFAKGEEARARLKAQWEVGAEESSKERMKPLRLYIAFLRGTLSRDEVTWTHWMRWNRGRRRQEPCGPHAEGAVQARSWVRVRERLAGVTVVEVELDTGRRNQIRLQASLEGLPLVGESMYTDARKGKKKHPDAASASLGRQALHGWRLGVRHPVSGADVLFEAPLASDMVDWLRRRKG